MSKAMRGVPVTVTAWSNVTVAVTTSPTFKVLLTAPVALRTTLVTSGTGATLMVLVTLVAASDWASVTTHVTVRLSLVALTVGSSLVLL